MKKQLWLASVGLPALAIMHCTSFAEPAQAAASTTNSALNRQNSKQIVKDCEDEWKANQEAMMKGG